MSMTFDEYQKQSKGTAQYTDFLPSWVYLALGLAGESGEVVDKLKKVARNSNGEFSDEQKLEIAKELGDVLWYISQLCEEMGISMNEVAVMNREKLEDRKARGVLKSRGDNR